MKFERVIKVAKPGQAEPDEALISVETIDAQDGSGQVRHHCVCKLSVLDDFEVRLPGLDALDAMTLALMYISKRVRDSEEDGWTVFWREPGDHCWLPAHTSPASIT